MMVRLNREWAITMACFESRHSECRGVLASAFQPRCECECHVMPSGEQPPIAAAAGGEHNSVMPFGWDGFLDAHVTCHCGAKTLFRAYDNNYTVTCKECGRVYHLTYTVAFGESE